MDKIENLNIDFVHQTQTSITYALVVMFVIGILLDVFTFVYRRYANWLLYFEIFFNILMAFVPFNYGETALIL